MPVLWNNGHVEALSLASQNYLRDAVLINENEGSNWDELALERRQEIIQNLVEREKDNVNFYIKRHQLARFRASYITLTLVAAWSLFIFGLVLAPVLFIAPVIAVPLLPILMLSFSITALTRLFLNAIKNYYAKAIIQSENVLEPLQNEKDRLEKEAKLNEQDNFFKKIDEINDRSATTEELYGKLGSITQEVENVKEEVKNTFNLLTRLGMFKPAGEDSRSPIPVADNHTISYREVF